MGLSKLSEECKNCPFVSRCKNKRMSKFRENGVMTKMDDVEAGIIKIGKEREDARKNVVS